MKCLTLLIFLSPNFLWAKASPIKSVKIIFENVSQSGQVDVLVAQKKIHSKKKKKIAKKDGAFEFLGGKVDPLEEPVVTLLRELKEEDPTGALYKVVKQAVDAKDPTLWNEVLELKKHEKMVLYHFVINDAVRTEIETFWNNIPKDKSCEEVYQMSFIPKTMIYSGSNFNFTPKTKRILTLQKS